MTLKERLSQVACTTEERIKELLATVDTNAKTVYESMIYSVSAGGKRIRPFLVLEFAKIFGANEHSALNYAAAIEMVHTYSLIHDDLPCMDNDDFRRGLPTNHKVYGEAVATLAGDGLLTHAFYAVASADFSASTNVLAVKALSQGAGCDGMIGGQIIDIENEGKKISYELLNKLHKKKTGALIKAAVALGCIAGGADDISMKKALEYAENIGIVFQIIDDILDKYGSFEELGKPIGSDAANGKTTFMTYMARDEALALAEDLTNKAVSAISDIRGTEMLAELAVYLLTRKS